MGQSMNLSCYTSQDCVLDSHSIQKAPPTNTNENSPNQQECNYSISHYSLGSIASSNYSDNLEQSNKIIKIQAYYRLYSFNHRYPQLKLKQQKEENYFISSLLSQYTTFATKQAGSSLGYSIKPLSIKYSLKYDYDLIVYTKIFIIESLIPSFYIGYVNISNQRHGYGTLYYKNGSQYEGHWQSNHFVGYNRYIDEEGTLYQGYFTNWYLNDTGIKRTLDGSHYSGNFVNSIKEGKGKEVTQDTIYQGEFHNDQYHGTGILRNLKENWEYQGQFANNKFEGIGIMFNSNGEKSQGEFMKGKMINNLSFSSLLTSTMESEKAEIKITMTADNTEKTTICFPLSSKHKKHFSSIS